MFTLQPCDPSYYDEAPAYFENEIVISARPEEVFDFLVNLETEKEWFPGFKKGHWITADSQGVKSIREYSLIYMRCIEHFTVWQRGTHLVFYFSECSLPIATRFMEDYRLTPTEAGGARLVWRICVTPNPWLCFLTPIFKIIFASTFRKATRNIGAYFARKVQAGLHDSSTRTAYASGVSASSGS